MKTRLLTFFCIGFYSVLHFGCQKIDQTIANEKQNTKRYNWHQRQIHPSFNFVKRDSLFIDLEIKFKKSEFKTAIPQYLEVFVHTTTSDSAATFLKKFFIHSPTNTMIDGYWSGIIALPSSVKIIKDVVLKFGPNSVSDQFILNWMTGINGWSIEKYLHSRFIASGTKISTHGSKKVMFAAMSDKLPSPPFSSNMPFIPSQTEWITDEVIQSKVGAYVFDTDTLTKSSDILYVIDSIAHPQFPELVKNEELSGPLRYLCSKEEFDKILKSTDGPENALEKFWIQSAGGREKARELIKTYYNRVWDANQNFTSYAEGWKTDRGMIYLVFGHPEKIEVENNLEIWSYTIETGNLQFAFDIKDNPIWGEIYILRRNEQYRPHWEFQVSQWRQGRIFK